MVVSFPGIVYDPREPPPPQSHYHAYQEPLEPRVNHARYDALNQWNPQAWQAQQPEDESFLFPQRADDALGVTRDDGFLPPISVSVNATITHDTAKVTVTQLFVNDTNSLIPKASYTFPLPPESTVVDFSCRIGADKILIGEVRPKSEAQATFQGAVDQDQTAGLLDQNSQELFTTTIGNLPARTRLKATLSFIALLKHGFEAVDGQARMTFTLPYYIAPRYGTPPRDIAHLLGRSATLKKLSISVDVLAATDIRSLTSPSHLNADIQIGVATPQRWFDFVDNRMTRDARCATVKLHEETHYLEQDFTLSLCTESSVTPDRPFACLERHPDIPGQSAVMLTVPPKYFLGPSREYPGGEIIFIADRSGSMSDKIDALKKAMAFFLAALPSGCSFNIWSFGTSCTSLWPHSQAYGPATRRTAESHVSRAFQSNLGGTELRETLKKVLVSRGGFTNTDIIVLTDGQIWDLDETIELVKRTRVETEGRVRFFSVGIGNTVSHELVEGIAKAGGGYAEVIHTASQGGWEGSILAVLEAAKENHVFPSSVAFDWEEQADEVHLSDDSDDNVLQSPHDISRLSPFMRNRVFFLLNHGHESNTPRTVLVTCSQPGINNESVEVPFTVLERPDTTIHKFAARALLGDLERGEGKIHEGPDAPAIGSEEERRRTKVEGEKLGCRWSLVSEWTSFVAIELHANEYQIEEDDFLDGDQEETRRTAGQDRILDLLRPQGDQNAIHRIAELAERVSSGNESSESESDESDTVPDGNNGHRPDDNDDSDDDYNPGDGGQGGGNSTRDNANRGSRENRSVSSRGNISHSEPESNTGQSESTQNREGHNFGTAVVRDVNIVDPSKPKASQSYRNFPSSGLYGSPMPTWANASRESGFSSPLLPNDGEGLVGSTLSTPLRKMKSAWGSKEADAKRKGESMLKKEPESRKRSEKSNKTSTASIFSFAEAPQNNLSAAPSIRFANPILTADPMENAKRELIRLLLPLQLASGQFIDKTQGLAGESITMEDVLGTHLEAFLPSLMAECPNDIIDTPKSMSTGILETIVRTTAVVALLELHFQSCKDLWSSMETKAKQYLGAHTSFGKQAEVLGFVKARLNRTTLQLNLTRCTVVARTPTPPNIPSLVSPQTHGMAPEGSYTGNNAFFQAQPTADWRFATGRTWPVAPQPVVNGPAAPLGVNTTGDEWFQFNLDGDNACLLAETSLDKEKETPVPSEIAAQRPIETGSTNHNMPSANTPPRAAHLAQEPPKLMSRSGSSPTLGSSRIEHEDLIRTIAAARETQSRMVGGEEIEVPEDI